MGYDATCTLTVDGKKLRGTALLEHTALVFRGPVRLVIPLTAISRAVADGTTLDVRFGDREASFDIGLAAPKWASRITNPPSRLDKLGVKPGMRVWISGVSDDALAEEIEGRGASVIRRAPSSSSPADMIFYAVSHRDGLGKMAALAAHMRPDGALWIVRPKGVKDITEAETMAAGKRAGFVDVKVVSFSATHTAEKFVIPVAKRGSAGRPRRESRKRGSAPSPGRT